MADAPISSFNADWTYTSAVIAADGTETDVVAAAIRLLGIPEKQADRLFHGGNSREDLGQLVAEIFGPRPICECTLRPSGTRDVRAGCPVHDDQRWLTCAHRADYASAAEHERDCAFHNGEFGLPVDDVPPNAGSAS